MSVPMKKHPTDLVEITLGSGQHNRLVGPKQKLRLIRGILMEMDFKPVETGTDQIPWRQVMKSEIAKYGESGLAIRGARVRDGMSQKGLAARLEIAQYNLSKMENGERPVGKNMAMKLAEIFKSDYRVFL